MAILRSTLVNGDLTVTGSINVEQNLTVDGNLNVQGDLTYIGVSNLRVKDKQIELNATDSGSAIVGSANDAGIVIRGARNTQTVSDDASILYDSSDDTLKVNKIIKGRVSNATTADKVAKILTVNVTDETGSKKTVTFDGSEAKTVDVNLRVLQNQIDNLTEGTSSIATQINNAIAALDSEVQATTSGTAQNGGVLVLQGVTIKEVDGKLDQKTSAVTAVEVEKAGAAAAVKTALISNGNDTKDSDTIKGAKKYADDLAAKKANIVHKHAIADVTGLQGELNKKAASDHNHDSVYDKKGDAAAVLGQNTDDKDTNTVYGVRAYAKAYADGLADNYDAAGAAATALSDAKSYADAQDAITLKSAKDYADGLNTALDARLDVIEGEGEGSIKKAAADAVAAVVAGAPESFDTLKEVADWIQSDTTGAAKLQTDVAGLKTDVSTLQTNVSTLESASHAHKNKAELDKIADNDVAKWNAHVANANIHVTAEQKKTWDAKQNAFDNANVLAAIDDTKVSNWNTAFERAHEHTNKAVLDGITTEKIAAWDGAVSAAGVSSVGGKAGALTLRGGSATLGDVNLSISDTGEISAAIVPESFDAKGDAAKALADAKTYADEQVSALSNRVDTKDVEQDGRLSAVEGDIAKIKDGTTLNDKYVNVSGDTMTGDLTMSNSSIVFGEMKIVWNSTDKAIEFVPTTPTTA